MPFPGDHVVEAGAEPGIAGPEDAVLRGAEAGGDIALIALGAVRHGAGIGGEEGAAHAGAVEDARAQQLGEAAAGVVLQRVRQQAEILVHVGIARARRELQGGGAGDDPRRFRIAEGGFDRRAMQHRHRPVVAQAGLVVRQVERAGRRIAQQRQPGADQRVEHRRVAAGIQHRGAGELLGDGAHAEQRPRREGDAPFRIGIAPGMAQQHLAVPQHGDGAARPGIGARQPGGEAFEPVHQAGTRRYFCRQRTPSGGGAVPSW